MPDPLANSEWKPPVSARATIVFVHGAVVNGWEMAPLRRRFRQYGYRVRQFHYHSMTRGMDENVERLAKFVRETEGDIVHVIGHSMGGVLARHVFEQVPDPRPGRIVAVGSPFLDCWVARRIGGLHARGCTLLGRTVHDHITHPRETAWHGSRDLGVLAGVYPFGIGSIFRNLPRPSDGVVLWEETRLRGVRDHVTFNLNHFGMLLSTRCLEQMARFLACSAFSHPVIVPAESKSPDSSGLVSLR
jgi:pimeloyl-ACP methyl ester carboxylesterase